MARAVRTRRTPRPPSLHRVSLPHEGLSRPQVGTPREAPAFPVGGPAQVPQGLSVDRRLSKKRAEVTSLWRNGSSDHYPAPLHGEEGKREAEGQERLFHSLPQAAISWSTQGSFPFSASEHPLVSREAAACLREEPGCIPWSACPTYTRPFAHTLKALPRAAPLGLAWVPKPCSWQCSDELLRKALSSEHAEPTFALQESNNIVPPSCK